MRRVSIGIELVAAPDVLVLDEPTSGLDSVSAARLVKLLKSLAEDPDSQTTIIASIHQPSSALYHSFSQVVLLSNGRQLYFGPGGSRPAEFFASQGRPCPSGYNVADHLLEIASGTNQGLITGQAAVITSSSTDTSSSATGSHTPEEMGSNSDGSKNRLVDETPYHEKNITYPPSNTLMKDDKREVDLAELGDEEKKREWWPRTHCATTFLTQMEVLSGREWRNLKRQVFLGE
jgi:ABC-type multidrug transport system ATPase subunit